MNYVVFQRRNDTAEQRMLELALVGNADEFEAFVKREGCEPKSAEIFMADESGWNIPPVKHYLLFELGKRGHAELLFLLVNKYGFVTSIYEDEYARNHKKYLEQKERDSREMPNLIYGDISEYQATRSAYYSPLPKYLTELRKEYRQKLRELGEKWLAAVRESYELSQKLPANIDQDSLGAYEQVHHQWLWSGVGLYMVSDGYLREHQRSRPRVNPVFEKALRVKKLKEATAEHKKVGADLLRKLKGIDRIIAFLNQQQAQPAA